jgi:GMP synthase-like glutamine amidotransferase
MTAVRRGSHDVAGPRVLLIEHERTAPAGLLDDWLAARAADVHLLAIDAGAEPDPAESYELIVSLGSDASAYDDGVPWIGRELALLRQAVASGVPVLGICFGGQLLARALGADVFRAARGEIGWREVRSERPDLIPAGPWFQWHFDTFTPPPGATLLAHNDAGPQAFIHGRSLGLQFHPEVDLGIVSEWAALYRQELDDHGVDGDELLERSRSLAEAARKLSWRLLDGYYERVALTNGWQAASP